MKEEERRAYEGHDTVCIIGRSREEAWPVEFPPQVCI